MHCIVYLVPAPQWMPHNVDNWRKAAQARLAVNSTTNVFVIECSDFVRHGNRHVVHQLSTKRNINIPLTTTQRWNTSSFTVKNVLSMANAPSYGASHSKHHVQQCNISMIHQYHNMLSTCYNVHKYCTGVIKLLYNDCQSHYQ